MKERYRVKAFIRLGNETAEVNKIVDTLKEAKQLADDVSTAIYVETEFSEKCVYDANLGVSYDEEE